VDDARLRKAASAVGYDVVFILADGLSPGAVSALPVIAGCLALAR
jgi:hypothetical protein